MKDEEGNVHWDFDVENWLEACRNMLHRYPKAPLYAKWSWFDVNRIPAHVRLLVFDGIYGKRSRRAQAEVDLQKSSGIQQLLRLLTLATHGTSTLSAFRSPSWPEEKKAALVFSLDVDSDYVQQQHQNILRELMERYHFKAAWFFLTGRYRLDHGFIQDLFQGGHEIAWHGHNHDHKSAFLPQAERLRRLDYAKPFLERYRVMGMRMDNFLWSKDLFQDCKGLLRYDSSFRDFFPVSEAGEGCCTSIPFKTNYGLWEIPVTLTPDPFLPASWTEQESLGLWIKQLDMQVNLGGLVHILLHPEPQFSLRKKNIRLLHAFFEKLSSYSTELWPALPSDIYRCARLFFESKG